VVVRSAIPKELGQPPLPLTWSGDGSFLPDPAVGSLGRTVLGSVGAAWGLWALTQLCSHRWT